MAKFSQLIKKLWTNSRTEHLPRALLSSQNPANEIELSSGASIKKRRHRILERQNSGTGSDLELESGQKDVPRRHMSAIERQQECYGSLDGLIVNITPL